MNVNAELATTLSALDAERRRPATEGEKLEHIGPLIIRHQDQSRWVSWAETVMAAITALPDPPPDTVFMVQTEQQLSDFCRTREAVFGKNYTFTAGQLSNELQPNGAQHLAFLAHESGRVVGVERVYIVPESRFAYLAGGGVIAAARRRGYYRNLVLAERQSPDSNRCRLS